MSFWKRDWVLPRSFPKLSDVHTISFDFDGVFTDNKVWVDQEGRESVRCDRADGLAFDMLRYFKNKKNLSFDFFILSKESNPVVTARASKLKIPCFHGIKNKLCFMREYFLSRNMAFDGLIYFGNDLNDFSLMNQAGYSVAPQDAHPIIKEIADLVLEKKGGEGCVREFIESFLLKIELLNKEEFHEFISYC